MKIAGLLIAVFTQFSAVAVPAEGHKIMIAGPSPQARVETRDRVALLR